MGRHLPVDGIGGARQGAASQRGEVHPDGSVVEPTHIPGQHVGVGHHVVGEGGRLGPLEVGVAGHHGVQMGLGLLHQDPLQIQHLADKDGNLLLHIQTGVHRHLVISAAGGVETLARIADALGEHGFDVHVDVLVVQGELHTIPFDLGEDGLETVDDLLRLVLLDDALPAQHGGVRHGALDVLLIQPGVKPDGGVEVVY